MTIGHSYVFNPLIETVEYDWDYFQFPGNVLPEMVPQGDNTFELIIIVSIGLTCSPTC